LAFDTSAAEDASTRRTCRNDQEPIRVKPAEVKLPAFLPDTPRVRQDWAEYLAGIEAADALVGEALAGVKASGQDDRTVIIFMGDHGPSSQRGKMMLNDLGLRVPLVLRAPGISLPAMGGPAIARRPPAAFRVLRDRHRSRRDAEPGQRREAPREVERLYAALRQCGRETNDAVMQLPTDLPLLP
jgi:hypothetical protein